MNSQLPLIPPPPSASTNPPKSRALPLGAILVVLLVLALASAGALGFMVYSARSRAAQLERDLARQRVEQQQRELDQQKADERAKLTTARNRQDAVLAQARAATNSLARLLLSTTQLATDSANLKTNQAGRQVALHPDLVALARRFLDTDLPALPAVEVIATRLEAVRRIELTVQANLNTTYEPEADFTVTAQNSALWAEQEQQRVTQAQNVIAMLTRESAVKVTTATVTADSPTLEAALRRLAEAEANERQRIIGQASAAATTNAMLIEAQAAAQRIVAEAIARSNKLALELQAQAAERARVEALRQGSNQVAQAENDAKLKALETQIQQIREEATAQSNAMWRATQDKLAELERKASLSQASNRIEAAKIAVATQTAEEEALKVQLRKKGSDPVVQGKLAAFITPGYWQANNRMSADKQPLSLTQLQTRGALEPGSMRSLGRLVEVAIDVDDKVRPRWKMNTLFWSKSPEAIEKVKEAQALLIELGPVLVEMGKLVP